MKIKKMVSWILVIFLAACGGNGTEGDGQDDADAIEETTDMEQDAGDEDLVDAPDTAGDPQEEDAAGPDAEADSEGDPEPDTPSEVFDADDSVEEDMGSEDMGEEEEAIEPEDPVCSGEWGTTYYVRADDGGTAEQCTGLVDAPYPGSGTDQPCALSHPFFAMPPGGTPLLEGGDRLVIKAGHYRMGHGAPGSDDLDSCNSAWTWDCRMPPVPDGIDAGHPTCIVGEGFDEGCPAPPELYAVERPWTVIDLTGSDHVRIECLELTDHSDCIYAHTGDLNCTGWGDYPHGDMGDDGIQASDSEDVTLRHLNIHGFPDKGIFAVRLTDWTLEHVRIAFNGWVGWDGDDGSEDVSNSGTMLFRDVDIVWNGCGETYPGGLPTGCWGQSTSGYGDGLGTETTGADWIFEGGNISHNTSDGLDLLYHTEGGYILIDGLRAEGNAGNQVKIAGMDMTVKNSVIVGNCAFFEGKDYTHGLQPCRAQGDALFIAYQTGGQASVVNTTIYGQGTCLIGGGPRLTVCDGTETLVARNNIYIGDEEYWDPGDRAVIFYQEDCSDLALDHDYAVVHGTRANSQSWCPMGDNDLCEDPLLGPFEGDAYGMVPPSGSPAVDSGLGIGGLIPDYDILGLSRPFGDGVDRGAFEIRY